MKRQWEPEELTEQWTLLPTDMALLANKTGATRLGFAVLLLFFHREGRFPQHRHEIARAVVAHIAEQVGVPYEEYMRYDWSARSIKYHRAQIRDAFDFREAAVRDGDELTSWLCQHVVPGEQQIEAVTALAYEHLRTLKIVPPTPQRVERVATEPIREVRRHSRPVRVTLVSAFCLLRSQEITDSLVELLIGLVHKIGVTAEQRVDKILLEDFKRVAGKTGLLYQIAEVSLEHPDELVRDVVYPVVGEQKLRDLVREHKSTGRPYKAQVHTVMRRSYSTHYRRMVPLLLQVLRFRSNNAVHRPVIRALSLLTAYADSRSHYFAADEDVPIEGVIPRALQELVVEPNTPTRGKPGATVIRINRITYEVYALQALREGLRCREIWVEGASRFRNYVEFALQPQNQPISSSFTPVAA